MKWLEPEPVIPSSEIRDSFHDTVLIAEQLTKKSISTNEQARRFLSPERSDLTSPFDFPEIEKAAKRIRQAIMFKERIGIWGDFDVDGQTSTTILADGLQSMGADVSFHIPIRASESHGIQLKSLQHFLSSVDPGLIITCDTGITEFDSMNYLAAVGIDTIITDHHTPSEKLPPSFAVINPRLIAQDHSFYSLAGVGTAYQLIRALFILNKKEELADRYLDLVALGTIADVADLTGENRLYARSGLSQLSQNPRQAIKAIAKLAGLRSQVINESHIGFLIAPRLNALGRLGDANDAVRFLLSKDEANVLNFGIELEALNARRKIASDMVFKSAVKMLEKSRELLQYPVIVLERENWEQGVVGIAAGRLAEKYNKPVILLNCENGVAAGSARSVEGINIIKAIRENSRHLIKYGGHPMAAGLSIAVQDVPEFREDLSRSVSKMSTGLVLDKTLEIDAYLSLDNVNDELINEIEQLAPFGQGNAPVVLVSKNVEIEKTSFIGKSQEHRKLVIKDNKGNTHNAVWWGSADLTLPEGPFDLAFYLRRDDYRSEGGALLEWLDFRESNPAAIEIHHGKSRFIINDYRTAPNQMEIVENLANEKDILFWAEGVKIEQTFIISRLHLKKTNKLAILVSPPNRDVLIKIIEKSDPAELFLFNLSSIDDSLNTFTRKLIGLLNFCISHKNGKTELEILEAALGQSREVLIKGLEFLREKGDIKFSLSGDNVEISRIRINSALDLNKIKQKLSNLLIEASAFRSFFQRVDLSTQLNDLKK
jgi:single-stranded-DNA-specific exonuclease